MTFLQPQYFFLLLLIIPVFVWHYVFRHGQENAVQMPDADKMRQAPRTLRTMLIGLPFWLRVLTFVMLVFCIARPQTNFSLSSRHAEGIDIMMAIDVSTSMLTPDMRPNRIEVAKQVATEFISARPSDRIGLILFGGEAYTACPLTTDHSSLLSTFKGVNCDLQQQGVISPGTAIGMGVASSVLHLKESQSKSKVVILLTDGENNAGDIPPLMAAEMAQKEGIRLYTISLGNGAGNTISTTLPNGEVYEAQLPASADNQSSLPEMSKLTGGRSYQAGNKAGLREIYAEIDKLEKTKLKQLTVNRHYEAYFPFALVAFLSLLLEILLRTTWLRRMV